jgi:hypothetical protein
MIANPYAYLPEHKSLERILAIAELGADCRRYSWDLLAQSRGTRLLPTPWPLKFRFATSGLLNRPITVVRRWIAVMIVAFCRRIQRGWRRRVARRRVARMTD